MKVPNIIWEEMAKSVDYYPKKYKPDTGLDEWLYFTPYVPTEDKAELKILSPIIFQGVNVKKIFVTIH